MAPNWQRPFGGGYPPDRTSGQSRTARKRFSLSRHRGSAHGTGVQRQDDDVDDKDDCNTYMCDTDVSGLSGEAIPMWNCHVALGKEP